MASRKKIIMFFGKERPLPDPFASFKNKKSVYYDFFAYGHNKGYEMHLVNGSQHYIQCNDFSNTLLYDGHTFVPQATTVTANAILDRSGGLTFPTKLTKNVLNPLPFKKMCASKINMYTLLGEHMPHTYFITSQSDLDSICHKICDNNIYVLKPSHGLGGKGIVFGTVKQLQTHVIPENTAYVMQEFIDTSSGIPSITKSKHDLRIVVLENEIVWITVRTPQDSSLLANVAQGGMIQDITTKKLPSYVYEKIDAVRNIINQKYNGSLLYSIDMGISHNQAFVFELNDQIGFPTESMPTASQFTHKLVDVLANL